MSDDLIEHILHVSKHISTYRVPPRRDARGYRSGEWRVADKIGSGSLRIVSKDELLELRIETESGDAFALCPIPYGQQAACVEQTVDSSRYFVLRVVDPASKRHAFIGLGFDDRASAFDFTEALMSHQRQVERGHQILQHREAAAAGPVAAVSPPLPTLASGRGSGAASDDVAALYRNRGDLRLKEGESIRVNIKVGGGASAVVLGGADSTTHAARSSRPTSAASSGENRPLPLVPLLPPPPCDARPTFLPPPYAPGSGTAPAPMTSLSGCRIQPPPPEMGSGHNDMMNLVFSFQETTAPFTTGASSGVPSAAAASAAGNAAPAVAATVFPSWATFD